MQEGAGVRQVIEDELRKAGLRLRDLDVQLELGLQESVRSAVLAGHGIAFISRLAVEADLDDGPCRDGARARARSRARDLPRPRKRTQRDPRRARVRRVRAGAAARVIVRWGLAELPKVLGELGIEEPLLVASERWAGTNLGVRTVARWTEVPSDQVAAAAEHVGDGVLAVGGGSAIDLGKADLRRGRRARRLGADDVRGRGVDAVLRHSRSRTEDARRRSRRAARPGSSTSRS